MLFILCFFIYYFLNFLFLLGYSQLTNNVVIGFCFFFKQMPYYHILKIYLFLIEG